MPQWTAHDGRQLAMDGSTIERWSACNRRLGNGQLGDGQLSNKALDGLAIKRWTARDG